MTDRDQSSPDAASGEGVSPVTIFVCTSCGAENPEDLAASDGARLYAALIAEATKEPAITVTPVDCLAVCERSVTIAFAAPGKWSYVVGDVDPAGDVADILEAARAVARSPLGIPTMEDRPPFFRKGVLSRVPPL